MFSNLGLGIGLRSVYFDTILQQTSRSESQIKWAEVITENYLDLDNDLTLAKLESLLKMRQQIPLALHGVSMNLGGLELSIEIQNNYLKRLKKLIDVIKPSMVSDHLCWTGAKSETLFDLLPVPFTEEMIQHFADRIKKVQDYLGQRILVENVSGYLSFNESTMPEWEFVSQVLEQADCGLLLDVNNVFVNSVNFKFNPKEYLKNIPRSRVGQIHLAGHSVEGSWIVDTHDQPVCEEVWGLYSYANKIMPNVSVMIERDDNFPDWAELQKELMRAGRIIAKQKKSKSKQGVSNELAAANI